MKVLMVHGRYPPDDWGGAEYQGQALSIELKRLGLSVSVLSTGAPWRQYRQEDEHGGRVDRLRSFGRGRVGGRFVLDNLYWVYRVVRWGGRQKESFDLIHAHQCKMAAVAAVALGESLSKPCIIKPGTGGKRGDLAVLGRVPFVGRALVRYLVESEATFVAISDEIKQDLLDIGVHPSRIRRISNGVRFKPQVREKTLPDLSIRRFVFSGRLEIQKGVDILVKAFDELSNLRPEKRWRLDILGDGSFRADLLAEIRQYNLEGKVVVHGFVESPEEFYSSAHYLIQPTRAEGMSNSVLEAMAFGVVPLVAAASGMEELLGQQSDDPFFIKKLETSGVFDVLDAAISLSPGEFRDRSDQVIQRINAEYTMESVAAKYMELYKDLVHAER